MSRSHFISLSMSLRDYRHRINKNLRPTDNIFEKLIFSISLPETFEPPFPMLQSLTLRETAYTTWPGPCPHAAMSFESGGGGSKFVTLTNFMTSASRALESTSAAFQATAVLESTWNRPAYTCRRIPMCSPHLGGHCEEHWSEGDMV